MHAPVPQDSGSRKQAHPLVGGAQPARAQWTPLLRLARGGTALVSIGCSQGPRPELGVIKALLPELVGNADLVARMRDEAAITASMVHAGLPRVLGTLDEGGSPGFVLEHIHGQSLYRLRTRLARVGMAWPEGVREHIYQRLLEALGHVHASPDLDGRAASVVHRDVSPENLLLTYDGRVVLIDFGVATTRARRRPEICGKPRYMSPEQARGAEQDLRADLFAVGLMLLEDFGAVSAWGSARPDEILSYLRSLRPLPTTQGMLPGPLAALVDRACAPQPAQRPASSEQMALELEEAVGPGLDSASPLRELMDRLFSAERVLFERKLHTLMVRTFGAQESRPTLQTQARIAPAPGPAPEEPRAVEPTPSEIQPEALKVIQRLLEMSGVVAASAATLGPDDLQRRSGDPSQMALPLVTAVVELAHDIVPSRTGRTLFVRGAQQRLMARAGGGRIAFAVLSSEAQERELRVALNAALLQLPGGEAPLAASLSLSFVSEAADACGITLVAMSEEVPMDSAKDILDRTQNMKSLVVMRRDGAVESSAGDQDPDVLAAVGALAMRQVEEISDLLALGEIEGWVVASDQASFSLIAHGQHLVGALGGAVRSLDGSLKSLGAATRGGS